MGVLFNITKEYFKDDLRKEDGFKVNLWGNEYIMKYENISFLKDLIPLNEKGDLFIEKKFDFFDEPVYICMSTSIIGYSKTKYFECHYLSKENLEYVVKNKIIEEEAFEKNWVEANYNFYEDDFLVLRILHETLGDFNVGIINFENDFYIDDKKDSFVFEVENQMEYKIFKNHKAAISEAEYQYYNDLDEKYSEWMDEDVVKSYIDSIGLEWINEDDIREKFYEKVREDDYDALENEDGEHGNQLNDFLLDKGLIEDTTEFFDIDFKKPKFKIENYRDKLIDKIMWLEDISQEEAIEIVDGYDEEEFIDQLCNNLIIQEDEDYFELDYKSADSSKITNAINNLIYDEIQKSDGVINAYLERFRGIPGSAYDLIDLAKVSFDKDNLGQYLSHYDNEEYKCEIDGNEYLVYINEH